MDNPLASGQVVSGQQEQAFDVLTYNVHLLPSAARGIAGQRSQSELRASAIGRQLASFDVIGINEAFDKKLSNAMLQAAQSESSKPWYVVHGPQRSGRHLVSGGLLLLSRFPATQTHVMTFQHHTRFLTAGFKADGFAAKGALHARLQISDTPDVQMDCFVTHLESRDPRTRGHQMEEFARFAAEHAQPNGPMLLLGDFNVAADQSAEYERLQQTLREHVGDCQDVGLAVAPESSGTSDAVSQTGGRRIDYIFSRQPAADSALELSFSQVRTLPFLDERIRQGSLSDHLGLACRVHWQR